MIKSTGVLHLYQLFMKISKTVTNLGRSPGVVLSLNGDLLASFLGDQEVLYLPSLGAVLDHEYHSIGAHNIPIRGSQLCQER